MFDFTSMLQKFKNDETAVSEIIGYAFVFSAVIATVIFISLAAAPIIDDAQAHESVLSMENNFIHIDGELQKVEDGVETRVYETELPGGQFRQLDTTTITFEQDADTEIEVETRPLYYETEHGGEVVYESGFIALTPKDETEDSTHIRHHRVEGHMDRNPVLSIPAVDHPSSVAGYATTRSTVVTFQLAQVDVEAGPETQVFQEDEGDVDVTIETEIPVEWEAYLEKHPAFQDVDQSNSEVTATVDFDDIEGSYFTVKSDEIELDFVG